MHRLTAWIPPYRSLILLSFAVNRMFESAPGSIGHENMAVADYACDQRPMVSAVLIIHGEPRLIQRTVASLQEQTYGRDRIHIVCLDDGTSPNALAFLRTLGREVTLHELPIGSSISHAKNVGLRLSPDNLILFLDDHIILDNHSVEAGIRKLLVCSDLAGVCGHYASTSDQDYNVLRDIKRESLYRKNSTARLITLRSFTTFSTGIAIVRKDVFASLGFPEGEFPPGFGGEDLPTVLMALNKGYMFMYVPELCGTHDHNLSLADFARKVEIEVRGRFSVLYWAANHSDIQVPYLHGFLSFPYFLTLFVILGLPLSVFSPWWALLPLLPFSVEVALSLKCFKSPVRRPLRKKVAASVFVLCSELLTIVCAVQYLLSVYKRPFAQLSMRQLVAMNRTLLSWELAKYRLRRGA